MVSRKIEKAQHGPTLTEVVVGASVSLVLGAMLAVVYLVLKPVWTGKDLPRAPAGTIFYVEGSRSTEYGKLWLRKRQLFTDGSSVVLNEDELNAWMMATTAPAAPERPVAGQKFTPPAPPSGIFQMGTPNFRIRDGVLQVGTKGSLNVELIGFKRQLIMQVTGQFVKRGGQSAFEISRFYIGSFPLHKLPGLSSQVLGYILGQVQIPEEIGTAWKKLANVTVEGSTLKLTMP
jgi:hypothetical protein